MRKAAVAGLFYAKEPQALRFHLESLWPKHLPATTPGLGAMVPHAGYMYSGQVAAQVYSRLPLADVYILIGPNHTGKGWPVALSAENVWETPLGKVQVEQNLSSLIVKQCAMARFDNQANQEEHALEVQLPFLQIQAGSISIVPITLGTRDIKILQEVGEAIASAVQQCPSKVIVLASSDMNHFANLQQTKQLDHLALEKILARDPKGLLETVAENKISMCGAGPVAAMLWATQRLGATAAELVGYATSADASGDKQRVVGYAGVIIK